MQPDPTAVLCRSDWYADNGQVPIAGHHDRIIRCGLPRGHAGFHDEMIDGEPCVVTWPARPRTPRVYAMPDMPADPNTRVRDRKGNVWRPSPIDTTLWRVVGRPAMSAEWFGLLAHYGPLTEVTDDHA